MPSGRRKRRGEAQAPLPFESLKSDDGCRYVGLDLSLRGAGVAVLGGAGFVLRSETFGYGLESGAGVRERLDRIIDVARAVSEIVVWAMSLAAVGEGTTRVAIEGYALDARFGGPALGELGGVVKVSLYQAYGIVPLIVQPTTARKVVFGHGGLDKKEIEAALEALTLAGDVNGGVLSDHNQRDAWVVAEWARRTCRGA